MTCYYCTTGEKHPLWVYMAVARYTDPETKEEKAVPHIGCASHPFKRVEGHNRTPGFPVGGKAQGQYAPHWQLDIIGGPFFAPGARKFKEEWRSTSRGIHNKTIRGIEMANNYKLEKIGVYARNPTQIETILLSNT